MVEQAETQELHMEGKPPVCSVVMPVYNTPEPFLREAIESILGQSLRDFEFIIVDNGSNECVRHILDDYEDARIRRLRLETNRGPAAARNCGIEHARGEFIAFMDSDDISLPERLAKQVSYLCEHEEVGCLGTDTNVIRSSKVSAWGYGICDTSEVECSLLLVGCMLCQSSLMIRRDVLKHNHIQYRSEYEPAEDYALLLDLIGKTKLAVYDEVLVYYRAHANGVSSTQCSLQKERANIAQQRALERYASMSDADQCLALKCIQGGMLTRDELAALPGSFERMIRAMVQAGLNGRDIMNALRKCVRKLFYHTHTLRGQWELMRSPLCTFFDLPLWWVFWCFITRGIL